MMITKSQAQDELKWLNNRPVITTKESDRIGKLKSIVQHYQAIAALSKELRPEGTTPTNEEWYTPSYYVELARRAMGSITLDPASNDFAQQTVRAEYYYTKECSGLENPWWGNVFCNPPYGRTQRAFINRAIALYNKGKIDQAIFLLNRSGGAWYLEVKDQCNAVCEVSKRIAFRDRNGITQNSPRYNNDFLLLGPHGDWFAEVFSAIGRVHLIQFT